MYRPPSSPPKGAWARHLHAQRKARDISATAGFELVRERLGLGPKSRAAYVAIDSGDRQPREDEAAILAEEFGWPPEDGQAGETPDLAAAIVLLTGELAAMRLERQQQADRLEELASLVAVLDERLRAVPEELGARGRTKE